MSGEMVSGEMVNACARSQPSSTAVCCPAVERRQYTLHPGRRETLIALFDREFVETQEAVGIRVIAQFRDIDRSDVFTGLRGFADMATYERHVAALERSCDWRASVSPMLDHHLREPIEIWRLTPTARSHRLG